MRNLKSIHYCGVFLAVLLIVKRIKFRQLIREVKKEFNIDITEEYIEFITSFPIEENHVFLCRVPQDVQPILLEGKDMKWFSLNEIKELTLGFEQNNLISQIENLLL